VFDHVPWLGTGGLKQRLNATMLQSDHTLICGPTGRGKTVLLQEILPIRSHVAFFGTKKEDDEYERMVTSGGWHRIETWPPRYGFQEKVMLWPVPDKPYTISNYAAKQKRVFRPALDQIFFKGKWACCFDELHWMSHDLGLYNEIASLHHQGRSSGLSLFDGFQRPAFVPVIVYSSAKHVFLWGTNYRDDLKKISSIAKMDALTFTQLREVMGSLDEYEFVYVNVRDRKPPVISQVQRRA